MNDEKAYKIRNKIRTMRDLMNELINLPNYPNDESNITEIMVGFSTTELNHLFNLIESFTKKIKDFDFRQKTNVLDSEIINARNNLTWDDTHIVSEETRTYDQGKLDALLTLKQKLEDKN